MALFCRSCPRWWWPPLQHIRRIALWFVSTRVERESLLWTSLLRRIALWFVSTRVERESLLWTSLLRRIALWFVSSLLGTARAEGPAWLSCGVRSTHPRLLGTARAEGPAWLSCGVRSTHPRLLGTARAEGPPSRSRAVHIPARRSRGTPTTAPHHDPGPFISRRAGVGEHRPRPPITIQGRSYPGTRPASSPGSGWIARLLLGPLTRPASSPGSGWIARLLLGPLTRPASSPGSGWIAAAGRSGSARIGPRDNREPGAAGRSGSARIGPRDNREPGAAGRSGSARIGPRDLLGPLRGPHRHRAKPIARLSSGRYAARIVTGLSRLPGSPRAATRPASSPG